MKNKFSKHWKGSKRPGKQRKFLANAPPHLKKKFASVNLSKELRKKHGKRNLPARKGDVVKIMRGKFKKKQGKILGIGLKKAKLTVEGIQAKKRDGSKVNIPLKASNLQIIELNLEDKKRLKTGQEMKSQSKEKVTKNKTEEKHGKNAP